MMMLKTKMVMTIKKDVRRQWQGNKDFLEKYTTRGRQEKRTKGSRRQHAADRLVFWEITHKFLKMTSGQFVVSPQHQFYPLGLGSNRFQSIYLPDKSHITFLCTAMSSSFLSLIIVSRTPFICCNASCIAFHDGMTIAITRESRVLAT